MAEKTFTVYRTQHGPVVREAERQVGQRSDHAGAGEGAHAVVHAHQGAQTTSRSARRWSCTPTRRTTRSSPTPTATSRTSTATSSRSAITKFDWTKPVDGSDPATEWQGLLSVDESAASAQSGERLAVQHRTTAPWSAAGPSSPKQARLSRRTWRTAARIAARPARDSRADGQEGLHARRR